ncbi:MAG: LysM peptidoglycan-binding domain-containing protein [Sedimentisphaerales bacterium]|nr:LysM peptidoglycan-binding domain-containing protein [Sedimentisphaerales bacterium]
MIQRDLKIGLVLGLVIVAGVVVKLAIDPRLSTEARMIQFNDSTDSLENINQDNAYPDDVLSQVPFSIDSENQYEQTDILQNEDTNIEIAEQNNDDVIPYSALQIPDEQTLPQIRTQIDLPGTSNNNTEVIEKPERFHIVQANENLSSISRIYYSSPNQWQKIVDANPDVIKNPNKIKPGMKLLIP